MVPSCGHVGLAPVRGQNVGSKDMPTCLVAGWLASGKQGVTGTKGFQAPGGTCSQFFQVPEDLTHVPEDLTHVPWGELSTLLAPGKVKEQSPDLSNGERTGGRASS